MGDAECEGKEKMEKMMKKKKMMREKKKKMGKKKAGAGKKKEGHKKRRDGMKKSMEGKAKILLAKGRKAKKAAKAPKKKRKPRKKAAKKKTMKKKSTKKLVMLEGEEKKEEMKEEKMTLEGLAGCKYADWDCIKESKADCDEDMCDDDDEDCWMEFFKEFRPCKKMDAGCWFGFFIELIELEPKMTDEGKMLGMWGATGCEYMDFECMGKALEDDEDFGCDEDMACWIATLIVLPPCELKDMDCWMAFKKAMMALAKEEGKKG